MDPWYSRLCCHTINYTIHAEAQSHELCFALTLEPKTDCQPLLQDQDPFYSVTALVLDWYCTC